jgi:hypothetical protein
MVENEIPRWFVAGEHKHHGPFTQSEIHKQIDDGFIQPGTFLWSEGMPDWLPAIEAFAENKQPSQNDSDWTFLFKDAAHLPAMIEETPSKEISVPRPSAFRRHFSWLAALIVLGVAIAWWVASKSKQPDIRDVTYGERQELNEILQSPETKPAAAAIALSSSDPLAPSFYIATNHRDGTQLDLSLQGVTDTLVGRIQVSEGTSVTVKKGLAHTLPIRQADGRPLAKGEYIISVSDGERILVQKTYFIGGMKNLQYQQSLKDYHAHLVSQAESEIRELKQLIEMISRQAHELNSNFQLLAARSGSQKKEWQHFLKSWQITQNQISMPLVKSKEAEQELFYADMFRVVKNVLGRVEAIQQTQSRYLDLGNVDRGLAAAIGNEISVLQADLDGLRARVQAAEAMPTTANGMPQWPVSNISLSDF